jgi:hypothetical protein
MAQTVEWFFGRGLSIGCGLPWVVPPDWCAFPRDELIARIKATLVSEMSGAHVDTSDIRQFLNLLANSTVSPWRHQFHTTNWDFLLQREILALAHKEMPQWCAETHVYHLNGTVEDLSDNSRRSVFVLESDRSYYRVSTTELNIACSKFIWSRTFVVVGMSFECEVDKYLLYTLNRVGDDLPVGESYWIVLNPDAKALSKTCASLQEALPRAKIVDKVATFRAWLDDGVPELRSRGAVAF